MGEIRQKGIFERSQQAYQLYDAGNLDAAKALVLQIEAECIALGDHFERAICGKYVAACLVDIGGAAGDEGMVKRGTEYFREWLEQNAAKDDLAHDFYNLGNGYFKSWEFHSAQSYGDGEDAEEHRLARHYYRRAIQCLRLNHYQDGLACQVWTNYGNCLDRVGRCIEAIDAYDAALRINPQMGMALGNKAIAISHLAPMMYGHTHLFYLEAIRLLRSAIEQSIPLEARLDFEHKLEQLDRILDEHGEMKPEEVGGIEPETSFHHFLCEFCARHGLFLNPATCLGGQGVAFYGDPMFISTMYADIGDKDKFDRYVTFLNEIKQDYVMGRYFLVQSQYQTTEIDVVDEGVSVFYPLDYSLYSTYIQLLKAANKQAIDILDKIACFIYDYCRLRTPKLDKVSFRNIWGDNQKMTRDLTAFTSPHLFALFNLAQDVSQRKNWQGDWSHLYRYRNALTHRFLVIHEMQLTDQTNADIPRAQVDRFLEDTIVAFKVARAALMYLILFVEHRERIERSKSKGLAMPVWGTPVEGVLRYRPGKGN